MLERILENKEKVFTPNENVKIDSIMLEENGKIESHFYFDEDNLHEIRSVSKVLIALAYGCAMYENLQVGGEPLSVETYIYPVLKNVIKIQDESNLEKIKKWQIKTLLTYSAGYDKQMFNEKCLKALKESGKTEEDFLDYAINYPLAYQPNEKYVYNNAETFLLSVFFQEAFKENIASYIQRKIFKPLGIENFVWKNYGKYCPGGTGLYLSAKGLFKIGQLMLRGGEFAGTRIISEEFISEMCSTRIETPYAVKQGRVLPKVGVGLVMHISRDGYVFKDGTNGQYLILNFEKNLLISILSSETNMEYVTEILRGII